MVKNVFSEQLEGTVTQLRTFWGLLSYFIGVSFSGYLLVNYNEKIISFWMSHLPTYKILLWVAVDLTYTFIGLTLLFILVKVFEKIGLKNKKF